MPVHILSKLREILARSSPIAATIYAYRLATTLFEILTTIADVLLLLPISEDQSENEARVDNLALATDFLLDLPGLKFGLRQVLTDRVGEVMSKYSEV